MRFNGQLLCGLLLWSVGMSCHASCSTSGAVSTKPVWVDGDAGIPGYYVGVGQAEQGDGSITTSMGVAHQAAVRDLAASIETEVHSSLEVSEIQSAGSTQGKPQHSSTVTADTKTTESALLRDVETDATWVNPNSCTIWLRVKVSENSVRVVKLHELLDTSIDVNRPLIQRELALEESKSLLPTIRFEKLKSGESSDFFQGLLSKADSGLAADKAAHLDVYNQFRDANTMLAGAGSPASLSMLAPKISQALGVLSGIASSNPYGQPPDYWPEQAQWAIAAFDFRSGNPCEGLHVLGELSGLTSAAEWRTRSQRQQQEQQSACGDEQKQLQAWRRLVFGQAVTIDCFFVVNGKAQVWRRACADLNSRLATSGAASVNTSSSNDLKTSQATLNACENGCSSRLKGVHVLFAAQGNIASRSDSENPQGTDYQFSGSLVSLVLKNGEVQFSDSFSGVGGWNPVSQDMAMDVLAIQAGKRLDTKLVGLFSK